MKTYCLGFAFSPKLDWVALIHKQRPDWQRGLLNGIGGHVEDMERPVEAMAREFEEETGVLIRLDDWLSFATIEDEPNLWDEPTLPYVVHCFCTSTSKVFAARTRTDEHVHIVNTRSILTQFIADDAEKTSNLVYNIPSLISLATTRLKAATMFPNQNFVYQLIQFKK